MVLLVGGRENFADWVRLSNVNQIARDIYVLDAESAVM